MSAHLIVMQNIGTQEMAFTATALLLAVAVLLLILLRQKRKNRELEEKNRKQEEELAECRLKEEKLRSLEELIEAQKQKLLKDGEELEEARRLRHDFRQELLTLEEFARTGNRSALGKYLPQMTMPAVDFRTPLCFNVLLNTLLRHYENEAREQGIRTDFKIQADEQLWLEAGELSVLFGNLLTNAVTAAKEAPEGNRNIRLRTLQTGGYFSISMGNTFGDLRREDGNGNFLSTKEEHEGIGLSTIRKIAESYGGRTGFRVEGELFRSDVLVFRRKID